jgi:hypothetical protein
MQESVPQSLKDRILKEVDINNDGVIDYDEFLLLGKLLHQEIRLKLSAAVRPITRNLCRNRINERTISLRF